MAQSNNFRDHWTQALSPLGLKRDAAGWPVSFCYLIFTDRSPSIETFR